jgi:DNA-binding SARP family transcriptional activator
VLGELAALHEGRNNFGSAEQVLGKILAEEPTSEDTHASFMRLYALRGRRGEALVKDERLKETLSRKLGAWSYASARALRKEIASGCYPPRDAPGGTRPEDEVTTRRNMAASRASFVDREQELLQVKRYLASTRLLTLAA